MSVDLKFYHIKEKTPKEGVKIQYFVTNKKKCINCFGVFNTGELMTGYVSEIWYDEEGKPLDEIETYLHLEYSDIGGELISPYEDWMSDVYWCQLRDVEYALYMDSGVDFLNLKYIGELLDAGEVEYEVLREKYIVDGDDCFWHYYVRFYSKSTDVYCYTFSPKKLDHAGIKLADWMDNYDKKIRKIYSKSVDIAI